MESNREISVSLDGPMSDLLASEAQKLGLSLDDAASQAISAELDRSMQSLLGTQAKGDNVLLFSRRSPR